ncbi:MAG: hypothetical protein WC362_02550 [Methanoregula sp.]|jgi:glycyl-tRNA synthetase (class II)
MVLQIVVFPLQERSDQKPAEKEQLILQKEKIATDYENADDVWKEYAKNRLAHE